MIATILVVLSISIAGALARKGSELSRDEHRADAWARLEVDRYNW